MIVVTLTHPDGLRSSLVEAIGVALGDADHRWLDHESAIEFRIAGEDVPQVRAQMRPFEADADIFVQSGEVHSAHCLLMADMDSTMVTVECLDELAAYAGMKDQVAEITDRAMRGELDFAGALKARVALLSGLDAGAIDRCISERVRPSPGALTLIRTLKERGVRTVLVSGGFTAFAEPVAAMIGFDAAHANRLEIRDGALTGRIIEPILGADAKRQLLLSEIRRLGLLPSHAVAVGDGANDIPMLQTAGLGVAIHAKPTAAAAAGARINHGDLSSILWALGIPKRNWIEAG